MFIQHVRKVDLVMQPRLQLVSQSSPGRWMLPTGQTEQYWRLDASKRSDRAVLEAGSCDASKRSAEQYWRLDIMMLPIDQTASLDLVMLSTGQTSRPEPCDSFNRSDRAGLDLGMLSTGQTDQAWTL